MTEKNRKSKMNQPMFTDCYCTQFRRVSNAITRIYDNALKPAGLRITQFSMLRALSRLGRATTTELAAELALDRTTISRNVKLLIDADWVDVLDTENKRVRLLSINAKGCSMIAKAAPLWADAQKLVEEGAGDLTKAPYEHELLSALQAVHQAAPGILSRSAQSQGQA